MKAFRGKRVAWVAASLAAVAIAAWVWIANTSGAATYVDTNSYSDQTDLAVGLTTFDIATRNPAPSVAGSTLDGGSYSLQRDRGHIVVMNVWASWCGPCRAETPELVRLANEYRSRGVVFVGIDTRDNTAAARVFAGKYGMPYPSVVDDGDIVSSLSDLVPVAAVPSTIVIDERGTVAARIIGRAKYTVLRKVLETELARTAGTAS